MTLNNKKMQGKSLGFKIFIGVMLFLILFIVGIFQSEFNNSSSSFLLVFGVALICGIIGGGVMQ